jgi:hypothetical protein
MTPRQVRRRTAVALLAAGLGLNACGSAEPPSTSGAAVSPAALSPTVESSAGTSPRSDAPSSPPPRVATQSPSGASQPASASPAPAAQLPPGPSEPAHHRTEPVLDQRVVVDFAVGWRPEHELSDEEVSAQRARVQAAQDEVLRALGGHGRLVRALHETAQASLAVDAEGREILRGHPRVAAVNDDDPEPAG